MTLLPRAAARLLGLLLLVTVAVAGIVVAVFCIDGGESGLSPARLAELIGLPELRDSVGGWLGELEAEGSVAIVAALCGVGAMILGALLLLGALVPGRDRLLAIERTERGELSARRRAVAAALGSLAERPRDVISAKVRVRPNRRRTGGKARIKLNRAHRDDETAEAERSRAALTRLEDQLSLRTGVRVRHPRRGGRAL